MEKYFKKITFPDNIHIPDTPDCAIPPYDLGNSAAYNILVQIEKLTDKAICDTIIEYAKNNGVTDLYLLDEEFVTTALKNEVERREAIMEEHTAIVAGNILRKIDEVKAVLKYIYEIEEENLQVKTDRCPYCISLPTIPLREKVYMLIKTYYEDELKDLEKRLKKL